MQFTSPDVNHGAQIIEPVVAADAAGASGSFSDAFGPARLHSALSSTGHEKEPRDSGGSRGRLRFALRVPCCGRCRMIDVRTTVASYTTAQ